jgi:hypothetical protein
MNSIKIYLLSFLLLFFFSCPLFSQNDFYNEKKVEKTEQNIPPVDIGSIDKYTTEEDYNEIHGINNYQNSNDAEFKADELYEDEVYSGNRDQNRKRNTIAGEIVAEVIVDVLFNAVFIIATCWH